MNIRYCFVLALITMVASVGCNSSSETGGTSGDAGSFSLAWSEYPSWSVFGVAEERGLIDKAEGKRGSIEEKWDVDIVLNQLDYETCINAFGTGTADAVCITNMDILGPANGRASVAILPTSTSDGADACIVTGIDSVDELEGVASRGLERSVSQYMFERNLEILGKDPAKFPFKQMDPGAAAIAMQNKQDDVNSIVVWNPFVMQTLRGRPDEAKVLFDSTTIPEEIIDMVVVGQDVLKRPGGEAFAHAVIETFYRVNEMMESESERDTTLVALGEKFADLELEDMKTIVVQTKFYKTPAEGIALFEKSSFQNEIMPKVVDFCSTHEMLETKPTIGFGSGEAQFRFDSSYMKQVETSMTE